MTEDEKIELVARAICVAEKMNPDDALGGWIHWKEAAEMAIRMTNIIYLTRSINIDIMVSRDGESRHPQDIVDDIFFEYDDIMAKLKKGIE